MDRNSELDAGRIAPRSVIVDLAMKKRCLIFVYDLYSTRVDRSRNVVYMNIHIVLIYNRLKDICIDMFLLEHLAVGAEKTWCF